MTKQDRPDLAVMAVEALERLKALEATASRKEGSKPIVKSKKCDLYSSIWASCDELGGGMGTGFKDMIALKGNSDIGDINTQIIQRLIDAQTRGGAGEAGSK